jgi:hypothetical protein
MLAIYEWPTTVAGEKLDAEYGAPTFGGPPFDVYEIAPLKDFALPADGETTTPTRWRFGSDATGGGPKPHPDE